MTPQPLGHPMDELQATAMQPKQSGTEVHTIACEIQNFTSEKCTDGDMKIVFDEFYSPRNHIYPTSKVEWKSLTYVR